MPTVEEIFSAYEKELEKESILKENNWKIIREISQAERQMLKHLQIIHQTIDKSTVSACIAECNNLLETVVRPGYENLEKSLTPDYVPPFYQFHDQWKGVTQKLSFLVALITFIEKGNCALYEDVAKALNMKSGEEKGLTLDLEDYLVGLLLLASELSRLAVNSVTLGDYNRALEISKFIAELAAGFRFLTFKNDYLRKRYDALKYDVKKIEEVVYDLSIRGLITPVVQPEESEHLP